jgi:hypothetical protein
VLGAWCWCYVLGARCQVRRAADSPHADEAQTFIAADSPRADEAQAFIAAGSPRADVAQAFPPPLADSSCELRRGSPQRPRCEGGRPTAIVAVSAFLATVPLSAQWLKYPTASRIFGRLGSRTERTRPRSPNGFVE